MAYNNFKESMKITSRWEGGYVNDPHDPGGETNYGITAETWKLYGTGGSVASISKADAERIYKIFYWDAVMGDDLPIGLDLAVFDFGVNAGVSRSAKRLQKLVGVKRDGAIGPMTLKAVKSYIAMNGAGTCIKKFQRKRKLYYALIISKNAILGKFKKGWLRRTNDVTRKALEMAGCGDCKSNGKWKLCK